MNTRLKNAMIWVFGALGGILWGYDTGVISGAMLFIRKDIELTPSSKAWWSADCWSVPCSAPACPASSPTPGAAAS